MNNTAKGEGILISMEVYAMSNHGHLKRRGRGEMRRGEERGGEERGGEGGEGRGGEKRGVEEKGVKLRSGEVNKVN